MLTSPLLLFLTVVFVLWLQKIWPGECWSLFTSCSFHSCPCCGLWSWSTVLFWSASPLFPPALLLPAVVLLVAVGFPLGVPILVLLGFSWASFLRPAPLFSASHSACRVAVARHPCLLLVPTSLPTAPPLPLSPFVAPLFQIINRSTLFAADN